MIGNPHLKWRLISYYSDPLLELCVAYYTAYDDEFNF